MRLFRRLAALCAALSLLTPEASLAGDHTPLVNYGGVALPIKPGDTVGVAHGGTGATTASANTVFAGPYSGSAAAPSFRSLVGADLPNPSASAMGGVQSLTCGSHNWFSTLSTSGVFSCSQPSASDVSGLGTFATQNAPTGSTQCVQANADGVVSGTGAGCGGMPGGSSGQLQYNNSGVFGGGDLSGDVTTSGGLLTTLANSGVTAGTYGGSGNVPQIAIDAKGRITSATNIPLAAGTRGIYEASSSGVPAAASFTWVNQGDATLTNGVGSLMFNAPSNSAVNTRLICQSAPATPFTVYFRGMPEAAASATVSFGVAVRNSTNGRFLFLAFTSPSTTAILQRIWQQWASATSFNANINTPVSQWIYTPWLRIKVDGSGNVTPEMSPNGWDWSSGGVPTTTSAYLTASGGGSLDQICVGVQVSIGTGMYHINVFQTTAPN